MKRSNRTVLIVWKRIREGIFDAFRVVVARDNVENVRKGYESMGFKTRSE